jgi:hypothetical protein
MAVLKYYDGSDWEPVVSALQGPTGPTGATGATGVTGPTGPNPGLTLINTTSFTGVSSQSINDVFSATYQNYKVLFTGTASTNINIDLRLRVGGADNSTASSYVGQYLQANSTTVTAVRATSTSILLGVYSDSQRSSLDINLFYPFTATPTNLSALSSSGESGALLRQTVGTHNQSTSYTGFTLLASSGTITGEISVFGYNK